MSGTYTQKFCSLDLYRRRGKTAGAEGNLCKQKGESMIREGAIKFAARCETALATNALPHSKEWVG